MTGAKSAHGSAEHPAAREAAASKKQAKGAVMRHPEDADNRA
jgi:hypothetical protein